MEILERGVADTGWAEKTLLFLVSKARILASIKVNLMAYYHLGYRAPKNRKIQV